MRYYLINQKEDQEVIVDLTRTRRISKEVYQFEFSNLENNKIQETVKVYVRQLAGKLYLSPNGVQWKKIPKLKSPTHLLHVNKVFDLFRGFKPSGLDGADAGVLTTQMPGKVVKVMVETGQKVKTGDPLIILEAMKMENEIKSSVSGTVKRIHVEVGQILDQGVLMLEIE